MFLLLNSCEMIVDVDLPEQEPVLTLNAVVETNKPITANIGKGLGILDTAKKAIVENAIVEVFENGRFKERLSYKNDGNYISNSTIPKYGNKYKILASAPGYKEVSAEMDIPSDVKVTNFVIRDSVLFDSGGNAESSISFTIHDPAEVNYYSISMYFQDSSHIDEPQPISMYISDSRLEFLESYGAGEGRMFLDKTFNGQEYKVEIFFQSYYLNYPDYSTWGLPKAQVLLNISTVTHEYYLYKKSIMEQYNSIHNPFAEPAPVYCNIKNGLGILLGKNNNFIPINK